MIYESGYDATCPKDVVIPKTLGGKTVTGIGDYAFYNVGITSIIIPDTVTSIGNFTFEGNSLTHITIPELVTQLGAYSVLSSKSLNSITIPDKVDFIGFRAFANASISTIFIPGTDYMDEELFFGNKNLKTIILQDGTTSIRASSFRGVNISSIEIPNSVTEISDEAFSECENLTEIVVRGKTSLADFTDSSGLTDYTDIIEFRP